MYLPLILGWLSIEADRVADWLRDEPLYGTIALCVFAGLAISALPMPVASRLVLCVLVSIRIGKFYVDAVSAARGR